MEAQKEVRKSIRESKGCKEGIRKEIKAVRRKGK